MTEADITTQPFRLSFGDYARFSIVSHFRNMVRWPGAAIYGVLIIGLPLLGHIAESMQGRYVGLTVGIVAMAFLWGIVVPAFCLAGVWWNFRRNALAAGTRSARLTSRSFILEGPGLFSELTWGNFRKVRRGKRHIYLHLTASMAYLIPETAFETPEAARIFLERARQLVAQSRHDQAMVFETPVTPAPIQGELQSQPYLYTFGLHFRLNVGLYYRALRPIFFAGLAVVYLILLWQNGWGLTEFDRAELLPQLGGFTVIMGGLVLIFPLILVPATWLFGRHHPSITGTRVASLTGDRLIIHGPSFHTELKLSDLRQVRRTRHLILFMVQPGSAVPVPHSAFASPAHADAFFDEAFSRWQAARPAPAAKTHLDGKS